MKKLINIPDELFSRISKNAKLFGWSVSAEINEMLYFCILARSDYVETSRGLKCRALTALEWQDDFNKKK